MIHDLTTERVPVAELRTFHRNPRQGDVAAIATSLRVNGQYRPIVVNRGTHTGRAQEVLAGNHTLMGARDLGWDDIAVSYVDVDDDQASRIVAADNRTADLGGYDDRLLAELLGDLDDLDGTGYDAGDLDEILARLQDDPDGEPGGDGDDDDDDDEQDRPSLADRFLVPPFDVLDARQGWWRQRKRAWLSLGIRSEEGRDALYTDGERTGDGLIFGSASGADPDFYRKKSAVEAALGRTFGAGEFETSEHYVPPSSAAVQTGTSVFDPVLCELVYRWFSPQGGTVLDPFAGGSVRGLVAAMLGRDYRGNDLSEIQVAANAQQAEVFASRDLIDPQRVTWTQGDSREWALGLEPASVDLLFSCPPYLWLERYDKDNADDLSNMSAEDFEHAYTDVLARSAAALREDRYAVLVVGDVRDSKGRLHDFRGMTIRAAHAAGLTLHNGAVLITPVGSLAMRGGRQFEASRVMGRSHQDVLVFVKGDRRKAADACGDVTTALPDDLAAAFEDAPTVDGDGDLTPEVPPDYTPEVTPVETHAGVLVKRDDAWSVGGASGAKARTMYRLASERGSPGIITAGARRSPQIERAALTAQALGIQCRVHVPAGADTDETRTCERAGAEVVRHQAGRLSVLKARYRTDAEQHPKWLAVPFGMAMQEYRGDVAAQAEHLPAIEGRLVVPCGSGTTLVGILQGLGPEHADTEILAVQIGHDPTGTLDELADGWRDRVTLVEAPEAFDDDAPRTRLGDLRLDPMYEAKCLPHLHEGDLLWCVGRRTSAT